MKTAWHDVVTINLRQALKNGVRVVVYAPPLLGEEGTCNGDAEQIGKAEEVLHLRALESRTEQEHILEK